MWICLVIHEILVNKDFTVTDDLISWLFVVTFVYSTYVQIALNWGFPVQLILWKIGSLVVEMQAKWSLWQGGKMCHC